MRLRGDYALGTQSFGGAVRNIFSSTTDSILGMFVKLAVQWAENMIMQKVLGRSTAEANVSASAAQAGSCRGCEFRGRPVAY